MLFIRQTQFSLRSAIVLLFLGAAFLQIREMTAQDKAVYPAIGQVVRDDPALDQLIFPDEKLEVLASGFEWSEGPVWIKEGRHLLFSDIPRNSIMKWEENKGISLFMKPS